MVWTMTREEKWYDKQATESFKRKYKVKNEKPKTKKQRRRERKRLKKLKMTEKQRRKFIFASFRDKRIENLRLTPEYEAWRKAVLERDNHTCRECNKSKKVMYAHHIKSFKMNPALRYDVDNGITLCKDCHEDLHIKRYDKSKKKLKYKLVG